MEGRIFSITLPPEAGSVRRARAFVTGQVSGLPVDPLSVALLTSELVTNVIRHARTDLSVTVRVGTPVHIGVADGAAATDAFRELIAEPPTLVTNSSPEGRGIALVHALAIRLGLDDTPDGGKVVWFEM